jgi:hypothetical protein
MHISTHVFELPTLLLTTQWVDYPEQVLLALPQLLLELAGRSLGRQEKDLTWAYSGLDLVEEVRVVRDKDVQYLLWRISAWLLESTVSM